MSDEEFIILTNRIIELETTKNEISRKLYKLKKLQKEIKEKRENNK